MNKKLLWTVTLIILLTGTFAEAQQEGKVARIGILVSGTASTHKNEIDVVLQGLHELGYIEGKNILFERRYADRKLERLPELAAELVHLKVDVMVTGGGTAIRAARRATSTTPIVVGSAGDLVGDGYVSSLAKPGGNITGSTAISLDASGKRLELLREIVPNASRVAVLLTNLRSDQIELKELEATARQLGGVKLQPVEFGDPKEFQSNYSEVMKQKASAVMILQSTLSYVYRQELVQPSLKHRLPSMCEPPELAEVGCLASYGPDRVELWRRVAYFVDKILKGAKPADLPVQQPTKFHLVFNLKTAKQIGVTIPADVLARASRLIR